MCVTPLVAYFGFLALAKGATALAVGIGAAHGALFLAAIALCRWTDRSISRVSHDRLVCMWGELEHRKTGWAFIADDGVTYRALAFCPHGLVGRVVARIHPRLGVALYFPLLPPAPPRLPTVDACLADFRASFR